MRILLIHNYYRHYGGEDRYVETVKSVLEKKGHVVWLYRKKSSDVTTWIQQLESVLRLFWSWSIARELSAIIIAFKPDIVQVQNIYPLFGPTVYWICKKHGIPLVQRVSNYRMICPSGILYRNGRICELCIHKQFKWPAIYHACSYNSRTASFLFVCAQYVHTLLQTLQKTIDRYIVPSEFSKRYLLRVGMLPRSRTTLLPSFTHVQKSTPLIHKGNFFLYVGRLSEEKGILTLYALFATLPDYHLIIIGDGPLKQKLSHMPSYDNIIMKGFLNKTEIAHYMRKALCTIIPSECYDVFPHTLIESWSCGTPVIVPKLGSFVSTVTEGKTGFFYTNGAHSSLKKTIMQVYKKRRTLHKMRLSCHDEYKKKYTIKIYLSALVRMYQHLIIQTHKQ